MEAKDNFFYVVTYRTPTGRVGTKKCKSEKETSSLVKVLEKCGYKDLIRTPSPVYCPV